MIRCAGCSEPTEADQDRTYHPGPRDEPQQFCAACWNAREREHQRQGLTVMAAFSIVALLAAAVFDLGQTSQIARVALWGLGFLAVSAFVHDLVHAATARLLGLRIETLSFGYGSVLKELRLGEVQVELRTLPVCGSLRTKLRSASFARARRALVFLAGPALNAGLVAVGLHLLGGWEPAWVTDWGQVHPLHMLTLVNAALAAASLLPLAVPEQVDAKLSWTANDGLSALQSATADAATVESWIEASSSSDGGTSPPSSDGGTPSP